MRFLNHRLPGKAKTTRRTSAKSTILRVEALEPRLTLSGLNLAFKVENPNYNASNVYVTFIAGTLNATYDGGKAVALGHSYSLSDLNGPVNLVKYTGGRIFVSLGAGVAGAVPPEMVNPDIPSYHVRHDKFEVTYDQTDTSSVANLTAVDFFGIPLEMNTYHTNSATPVETLTYRLAANNLETDLAALAGNNTEVRLTENGQFLRVLSPHTPTLHQVQAYPSMQPYIDAVKTWQQQTQPGYTTIEGLYAKLNGTTPATQTQNYSFHATIESDGSLKMVGGGALVGGGLWAGSNHTILVSAAEMAQGIYLGNVAWTVDGASGSFVDNDVYAAAVRDVLAGFNLGFIASATIDPATGTAFGVESSSHWWTSSHAFEYLQPQHAYYNQYAREVTDNSDAYSWAFSDRWSHVQAHLHGLDTLEVVVLPDTAQATTAGLYDPATSLFFLRDSNSTGNADIAFGFGAPGAGWTPLAGDWTGNGTNTVGLYDPATSVFYQRDSNTVGNADNVFGFGMPGAGWLPVVGDWTGVGQESVGLYDPSTSLFYLRNSNSVGGADIVVGFGAPGAGWLPVVGDWDGDGKDTVGLYDPTTSLFYLKNTNTSGAADTAFGYGMPNAGWLPVSGDWNGNGPETIGLYDPSTSLFYLQNGGTSGRADVTFGFGMPGGGMKPITGSWTSTAGLLAADGVAAATDLSSPTQADVSSIVDAAIAHWAAAGLDDASIANLRRVEVVLDDLPGALLGQTQADRICLDRDAAGHGWFIDPTPGMDEEFVQSVSSRQLTALDPRAVDRIDLQTVVEHELGHIAGLQHLDSVDSLMSGTLPTGVRRTASRQP